jgi:hypothetical protein
MLAEHLARHTQMLKDKQFHSQEFSDCKKAIAEINDAIRLKTGDQPPSSGQSDLQGLAAITSLFWLFALEMTEWIIGQGESSLVTCSIV